ncbi:MAG TPA: fatty acid desaturase [Leptolyngbyaceae cyanobacterium]
MQSKTAIEPGLITFERLETMSLIRSEAMSWGIIIAGLIIVLWLISEVLFLSIHIEKSSVLWLVPAIGWQTFLYTGLFITAHDAMHGVVFPQNIKINNLIGTIAVTLYGLLSYDKLLKKHWFHHKHPATELDPDFHDGKHKSFFAWYFHFMKGYANWQQIIAMTVVFYPLILLLHIPIINLALFWWIPSILSSLQLFYFGTFLTHREPTGGYKNHHRAESTHFSTFWSFITCYHFGYHQEHHEYPHVPWWKLPEMVGEK